MSSLRNTPHGTYEVRWWEGQKQRQATFKRRSDALAFQGRLEVDPHGVVRRQNVPTLDEFAVTYLAGKQALADSTLDLYCRWMDTHVSPYIGHLKLCDISPPRLAEWQDARLAAGAGRATIGKVQALLSQMFDEAVLPRRYMPSNPALSLKRPAYRKRAARWLTAGEVEQLRMWYLDRADLGSATLISVLAYVGVRPQDALALKWSDLDPGKKRPLLIERKNVDGQIHRGGKTGDGYIRRVYVPPMVQDDLATWRDASPGRELIFPRRDGRPWRRYDFDNWRSRKGGKCFKSAATETGIGRSLRPYDLRHTGATLYVAAGWSPAQVARQLGHSIEVSMGHYQHLFDTEHDEHRSVESYIREARGLAPSNVGDLWEVEAR